MKKVNPWFIGELLNPLGGGADDFEIIYDYKHVNPNSEKEIKEIIRRVFKPEFDKNPIPYKEKAKASLSYYLTTDKIDFGSEYDACLLPFTHPDEPRKFFEWLWEVYYPGEDYFIKDTVEYEIIDDINEPLSYFMKKK